MPVSHQERPLCLGDGTPFRGPSGVLRGAPRPTPSPTAAPPLRGGRGHCAGRGPAAPGQGVLRREPEGKEVAEAVAAQPCLPAPPGAVIRLQEEQWALRGQLHRGPFTMRGTGSGFAGAVGAAVCALGFRSVWVQVPQEGAPTCVSSEAPSRALASSGTPGGGPCGLKISKPCDPQPRGTAPGPAGPQADIYCGEDVSQRRDGRPPCHRPEQGLNQVPARQGSSGTPSVRAAGRSSSPARPAALQQVHEEPEGPGRKPRLSGLRPALICRQRFPGVVGAAAGNPGRGPVPRAGHPPAGSVGEGGGADGADRGQASGLGDGTPPGMPQGRPARPRPHPPGRMTQHFLGD